jgi:hypothetical protein
MLGQLTTFRDVPFFSGAHHDVTLAYVGHAPKWDQVTGYASREKRDATVVYETA